MAPGIQTRRARATDSEVMRSLAAQLGYEVSRSQASQRLDALLGDDSHLVLVAEGSDGVVGWIHLLPRPLLMASGIAEIGGLVVDQRHRRGGIGLALVHAAEQWAGEHGYAGILVKSNAAREESHAFYVGAGYERTKTQEVYKKELKSLPPG